MSGDGRRRNGAWTLALAVSGLLLLAVVLAPTGADAGSILQNGGFESWGGSGPTGWGVLGGTVVQETDHVVSGSAARITSGQLRQSVAAVAGGTYTASIMASGTGVSAELTLQFAGGLSGLTRTRLAMGPDFEMTSLTAVAPPGTESVTVTINFISGAGGVELDNATLEESAPPPTATLTPTPNETPTETSTSTVAPSTSATSPATASATDSPPNGESTKTATATKTPTPTKTPKPPTPTRTPKPDDGPAATSTPKAPKLATPTPTPHVPTSTFGGLIENGDFEDIDEDRPWGWSKFGGSMGLTAEAYHGNWAGTLDSDTSSTKWLYQVAGVEAGNWYRATGFARASGGEAWLRLSWYASDDGSGSALDSADGGVVDGDGWSPLDTGAVQAPEGAGSVRLRLMLRPTAGSSRATFDDVMLETADAPPATPTPTQQPAAAAGGSAETPSPRTSTPKASTGGSSSSRAPDGSGPGSTEAVSTGSAGGPMSLRLSEVLADPQEPGNDAAWEWVEIVNVGDRDVDTAGWKLGDGKEMDVLPSAVVPAGGYAVVAGKSAQVVAPVVLRMADGTIGGGLNNGGDRLRLVAPDGSEVDALSYGDDVSVFEPPPKAAGAGKTLGVKDAGSEASAENWAETDRPTPGEANVFPRKVAGERAPNGSGGSPAAEEQTVVAGVEAPSAIERGSGGWSTLELGAGSAVVALAAGVVGYSQRRRLKELATRGTRGG